MRIKNQLLVCSFFTAILSGPQAIAQAVFTPNGDVGSTVTPANGRVGVGTNAPEARLDVRGNGMFTGGLTVGYTSEVGANNGFILGTAAKSTAPSGGQGSVQIFSNDASNPFQGWVSLITDPSAGNRRLSIGAIEQNVAWRNITLAEGGGNVGIGTTSPAAKLDVSGNLKIGNGNLAELQGPDRHHMIVLRGKQDGIVVDQMSYYEYGDHVFYTGGVVTGQTEKLRITSGGNVGIGTTAPTHKLAVNGAVRAKEVIVDTGWADYVFADDYDLKPLVEVEAYIREKKHLPGIPSAAEVAENGVSLGEMQARMMATMEEMMLHLIELKKENTQLRQEVNELKADSAK